MNTIICPKCGKAMLVWDIAEPIVGSSEYPNFIEFDEIWRCNSCGKRVRAKSHYIIDNRQYDFSN